jgi:protein-L-isoaspartate(D-aspartate) O-methyltransferase
MSSPATIAQNALKNAANPDFSGLRAAMVTSQLRVSKVTDEAVFTAMGRVQREHFVPPEKASVAYADQDVALGNGRNLMQPLVLARLLSAADVRAGCHALVVGSGTGYSSAVMAEMGVHVTALECDATLRDFCAKALARAGYADVKLVSGALPEGYGADAPYDIIIIDGGFELLPESLATQLADSGTFVGVEIINGVGRAVSGRRVAGYLGTISFMNAQVHGLPGFEKSKEFAF